jgi:hypothetical protein
MAKENEVPNITCNRFVAFLDIMGFKERLLRDGHDEVKKILESLRPTLSKMEQIIKNELKIKELKEKLEEVYSPTAPLILPISFSDSIILVSDDETLDSLSHLVDDVRLIFFQSIFSGIPMKGAIAHGKMTADRDNSLYFGQPLIDAFELQQDLQLYGVVLHHTAERRLPNFSVEKNFSKYGIIQYLTPLKSQKIQHYLLDWTLDMFIANEEFTTTQIPKVIRYFGAKLYGNVSGTPRIYVDNTLDFVREIQKRKQEQKQ